MHRLTRIGAAAIALVGVAAVAFGVTRSREPGAVLRVCADPNNLPFSDERQAGFENRLARLVGEELGARVEYTWWAQRRGYIRNTLGAGKCDVLMGVPTSMEMVLATRPYYRSTYVFVARDSAALPASFDDPRLRSERIGVQLVGDDGANSPPAHALARRGILDNLVGFTVYGDYSKATPTADVMRAVSSGDVDVAIVWGPLAGYFARDARPRLLIAPVVPQIDLPFLPFVFDISMGVRRTDVTLRDTLNAIILRRRDDIDRLLEEYRVPRVDLVAARADRPGDHP